MLTQQSLEQQEAELLQQQKDLEAQLLLGRRLPPDRFAVIELLYQNGQMDLQRVQEAAEKHRREALVQELITLEKQLARPLPRGEFDALYFQYKNCQQQVSQKFPKQTEAKDPKHQDSPRLSAG